MKTEALNVKKSKAWYREGLGGKKGTGELCNSIIISKLQEV